MRNAGRADPKDLSKLCRSAEIQQKKCMQLSGGALCKAAWKEISGIFGEDSAEAGKYRTEGML